MAKYVFHFQKVIIPYYFCFVDFDLYVAPSFVRQISIIELVGSHLPLVHMRSEGYSTWSVCVCVRYHIFAIVR